MRDGWRETTVGDVLSIDDGPAVDNPWDYELLTVRLHAKGLVPSGKRPNRTAGGRKHFVRRQGQILIGRQNYDRQCVGVVTADLDGHVTSNAITALRPNVLAAPGFAELVMASPNMAAAADLAMSGTGQREIGQRALLSLPMLLPPLDEQRRIVDLIGALDDAIGQAMLLGQGSVYAEVLRFLSETLPSRPVASVVEAAFSGGTPSRQRREFFGGGIPWLKSGEVENDAISATEETITREGLEGSSARLVPEGATVVAMYGQGDTKGRAGYVASPITTNQAVLALVPDSTKVDARYLLHAVRSRTESLRRRAVGNAQPNLSKALVLTEQIPVPEPVPRQEQLREALDALRDSAAKARRTETDLRNLRSTLLMALLSGEHEIPASYDELLEVS